MMHLLLALSTFSICIAARPTKALGSVDGELECHRAEDYSTEVSSLMLFLVDHG